MSLKKILFKIIVWLRIYPFISIVYISKKMEGDWGHFLSALKYSSVDRKGNPLPWFSYPAINFLEGVGLSTRSIFEWGSGNSTLYWSRKALKITSVEYNQRWYEKIHSQLSKTNSSNFKIIYAPGKKDYLKAIGDARRVYDIIVIDGLYRAACAREALNHLKKNGMIILDNAERYREIKKLFRGRNLTEIDFHGFGPINHYPWTTAFFLKKH